MLLLVDLLHTRGREQFLITGASTSASTLPLKFDFSASFWWHKLFLLVHIYVQLYMESSRGTGEGGRRVSNTLYLVVSCISLELN